MQTKYFFKLLAELPEISSCSLVFGWLTIGVQQLFVIANGIMIEFLLSAVSETPCEILKAERVQQG